MTPNILIKALVNQIEGNAFETKYLEERINTFQSRKLKNTLIHEGSKQSSTNKISARSNLPCDLALSTYMFANDEESIKEDFIAAKPKEKKISSLVRMKNVVNRIRYSAGIINEFSKEQYKNTKLN